MQEEQLEKATDAVMHNFCLFRSPRTPGGATELQRWEVKHIMRVALEAALAVAVERETL